mgnify:FL=1
MKIIVEIEEDEAEELKDMLRKLAELEEVLEDLLEKVSEIKGKE